MDTSTRYLGLRLAHPFMAGASPMSAHLDSVKRLEDAGTAAIVLHSLFEEQITMAASGRIHQRDPQDPEFAASLAAFPRASEYPFSPAEHLEHLRRVKHAVHVPVVASLNGAASEAWLREAKLMEQAGADALEMNFYAVVTDTATPGLAIETQVRDMVLELKRTLRIPVAVKAVALLHRVRQPRPPARSGGRRWSGDLQPLLPARHRFPHDDRLAQSRAVTKRRAAAPAALAGDPARAGACLARRHRRRRDRKRRHQSHPGGRRRRPDGLALLRHGPGFLGAALDGLKRWMEWQHVESVDEMRGRVSLQHAADPSAFERANYIRMLHSWSG